MHFFDLRSFQHLVLFLFPTLIFILMVAAALKKVHFRTRNSERRFREIRHVFPGGIGDRDAPIPLGPILLIVGFLLWASGPYAVYPKLEYPQHVRGKRGE